ncbi:hypothetical protein [Pseudooceanicola sp. LIPI14-2-Ac024]|uniref:COG4315 family predicted lipoprotein n=1 Tax=Pseudooceanicola sp. LIPI14-2-Ac024 TaxID=3344875 RepID=UPI0035CFD63C
MKGIDEMKFTTLIVGTALALTAGMALAGPQVTKDANKGVLADGKGMTLYIFDKDRAGESTCYGGCAKSWPPFFAAEGARADGAFSLVQRKDGRAQWAVNGQPLYYWAGDRKPGDTTGDGVGGTWHVIR